MQLSGAESLVLESYKTVAEGLADYLGEGYEIVVHSLENRDHSIIKIINGYYTGRFEGGPVTELARKVLEQLEAEGKSYLSFFTRNKKGEPLKSASIAIRGEGGRIIGILSINFYLSTSLANVLSGFSIPGNIIERPREKPGVQADVDDYISHVVMQVRTQVLESPQIPAAERNKEIVRRLHEKGVFNLKDAVVRTAELLGVSRNTVYMHLRKLR